MPQRMSTKEKPAFWHGLDVETEEELELGVPPPDMQLEDVCWWVRWGLEPELAPEGIDLLA